MVLRSGQFRNVAGESHWDLLVGWVWGVRESEEPKMTPGFRVSDRKSEVSMHRDGTAVGAAGLETAGHRCRQEFRLGC